MERLRRSIEWFPMKSMTDPGDGTAQPHILVPATPHTRQNEISKAFDHIPAWTSNVRIEVLALTPSRAHTPATSIANPRIQVAPPIDLSEAVQARPGTFIWDFLGKCAFPSAANRANLLKLLVTPTGLEPVFSP